MTQCAFENFDITIFGDQPPYLATFAYRGQSAQGAFADDTDSAVWSEFQQGMAEDINLAGPAISRLGDELFTSLVQDELRDLWVAAQQDLDRGTVPGLRIRLMLRPPSVAALPWEILRDPYRRHTFAADHRTPLVRIETQQRYIGPARPLAATLPLKMLLVVPTDPSGRIDGAAEEQAIRQALAELPGPRIELTVAAGELDILDVRHALGRIRPDLVHIVTHGADDGLLLWRDGTPAIVSSASLRTALGWADSVKLVVLNACRSAQDPTPAPLASLGAQLLQTGIPAVVAMQYDIRDRDAVRFSQLLYAGLMDGPCAGRIDAAVSYARSGLYALNDQDIGFGTPVLWLNSPNGVIFEPITPLAAREEMPRPAPVADIDRPAASTSASTPASTPASTLNTEAMTAWADSLAAHLDPDRFSGDLKLLAIQVRQLRQDFLTRLNQLTGLYEHGQQGDHPSSQIRRMEALLLEKQETLQRLDDLIQSQIEPA